LVALTQGWVPALIAVIVLLIYQFVEGQVIQPLVYSRTVSLSPLLIILASIIGAHVGGIVGVLLAIPVAAAVQIVIIEILAGTASGKRAHLKEA
jgi:putative heme transporter